MKKMAANLVVLYKTHKTVLINKFERRQLYSLNKPISLNEFNLTSCLIKDQIYVVFLFHSFVGLTVIPYLRIQKYFMLS